MLINPNFLVYIVCFSSIVPSPPTSLLVTSRTADSLTLTWTVPDSERFTGYIVTVSEGEHVKSETPAKDATSVEIAGLVSSTEYSIKVVTANNQDESPALIVRASTSECFRGAMKLIIYLCIDAFIYL